jgi:anti-sigma regulatory factor (Ser/Thr protein kinase)
MTSQQTILFTFVSIIGATVLAAHLLKIYRKKKESDRGAEPPGPKKIEIELNGDVFELDKLAIILDDLVRYDVPVKTILDLNIILEEVYAIIIKRTREGQRDVKVRITLILEQAQIRAIVRDRNDEFNPTEMPRIDLNAPIEEISFQGLGFHMVRHLADGLNYQWLDGQNILTITKNTQPDEKA